MIEQMVVMGITPQPLLKDILSKPDGARKFLDIGLTANIGSGDTLERTKAVLQDAGYAKEKLAKMLDVNLSKPPPGSVLSSLSSAKLEKQCRF